MRTSLSDKAINPRDVGDLRNYAGRIASQHFGYDEGDNKAAQIEQVLRLVENSSTGSFHFRSGDASLQALVRNQYLAQPLAAHIASTAGISLQDAAGKDKTPEQIYKEYTALKTGTDTGIDINASDLVAWMHEKVETEEVQPIHTSKDGVVSVEQEGFSFSRFLRGAGRTVAKMFGSYDEAGNYHWSIGKVLLNVGIAAAATVALPVIVGIVGAGAMTAAGIGLATISGVQVLNACQKVAAHGYDDEGYEAMAEGVIGLAGVAGGLGIRNIGAKLAATEFKGIGLAVFKKGGLTTAKNNFASGMSAVATYKPSGLSAQQQAKAVTAKHGEQAGAIVEAGATKNPDAMAKALTSKTDDSLVAGVVDDEAAALKAVDELAGAGTVRRSQLLDDANVALDGIETTVGADKSALVQAVQRHAATLGPDEAAAFWEAFSARHGLFAESAEALANAGVTIVRPNLATSAIAGELRVGGVSLNPANTTSARLIGYADDGAPIIEAIMEGQNCAGTVSTALGQAPQAAGRFLGTLDLLGTLLQGRQASSSQSALAALQRFASLVNDTVKLATRPEVQQTVENGVVRGLLNRLLGAKSEQYTVRFIADEASGAYVPRTGSVNLVKTGATTAVANDPVLAQTLTRQALAQVESLGATIPQGAQVHTLGLTQTASGYEMTVAVNTAQKGSAGTQFFKVILEPNGSTGTFTSYAVPQGNTVLAAADTQGMYSFTRTGSGLDHISNWRQHADSLVSVSASNWARAGRTVMLVPRALNNATGGVGSTATRVVAPTRAMAVQSAQDDQGYEAAMEHASESHMASTAGQQGGYTTAHNTSGANLSFGSGSYFGLPMQDAYAVGQRAMTPVGGYDSFQPQRQSYTLYSATRA